MSERCDRRVPGPRLTSRRWRGIDQLNGEAEIAYAADADALATALFVMEISQGLEFVESQPEVEAILVDADGEVTLSSGLRLQGDHLRLDWQ